MKAIVKFVSLFLFLAFFIYESSILYANSIPFQLGSILIVIMACRIRFGFIKLMHDLRLFLPFIITMLCVYVIMGLLGVRVDKMRSDSVLMYWLTYGLTRTSLFINTMFVMQLLLSYISINDILSLPMKILRKRYLLLGRALFVHSVKYIVELEFHLKLMPEYQSKRLSFRQWLRFKLQLSLGIILMILRESKLKGELIDNRIKHCFIDIEEHN